MSYPNRRWVILLTEEVEEVDFSQVMETSAGTLRWSEDSSKTIVKYEGRKPRFLYGKDTLTHEEILQELAKSEWTPEEDPLV